MKNFLIVTVSFISLLVILTGMMVMFSPYENHDGLPYKAVKETIEINAPVEVVFEYIGNSSHANNWSVFVDHITPLNPEENPDGTAGCSRRCFTGNDETGETWDETILVAEKNKRRRLNIYNTQNFFIASDHLLTEQLYEKTGENSCKLTLTLFFDEGKESFPDLLKMHYASYQVAEIFRGNLLNIKKFTEELEQRK